MQGHSDIYPQGRRLRCRPLGVAPARSKGIRVSKQGKNWIAKSLSQLNSTTARTKGIRVSERRNDLDSKITLEIKIPRLYHRNETNHTPPLLTRRPSRINLM